MADQRKDGALSISIIELTHGSLERRLPIDQETFDAWIGPVVGSIWEEQAKENGVRDLGRGIRLHLLQICLNRPSKKRKANNTVDVIQETASTVASITAGSPASPATPSTLPQVRRIDNSLSSEGCNADQSFRAANQPTDTLNVPRILETSSRGNLSTSSAQDDTFPPPPASRARSLMGVVQGGVAALGSLGHGTNIQGDIQRTPQDEESVSTTPTGCMSPGTLIPPLFYTIGSHIPKVMIDRAMYPQARWSEHGELDKVTPYDAGLHGDLVNLLSNVTELQQCIEELISLSIISSKVSSEGLQTYTCQYQPAQILYDQNRAHWINLAFELCCYVFPRDQILESS